MSGFVGIVAPMWSEARTLASMLPNGPRAGFANRFPSELPIELAEGSLLWVSGPGPERARRAACELLERGANSLVSWGIAGGLDPALEPGSLLLPESILDVEGSRLATDADWRARVRDALSALQPHSAPLIETRRALALPTEKAACFLESGAAAVDVESATLAQAARGAGRPYLAVRVVCDGAAMTLPQCALLGVDEHGRTRPLAILKSLARRPGQLADLFALERGFAAARATLRLAARRLGPTLDAPRDSTRRPAIG